MRAPHEDVPNARLWVAYAKTDNENDARKFVSIEAERFVDAREVARRILRVVDVVIVPAPMAKNLPSRTQVRWAGNAANRVSTLRMQIRHVTRAGHRKPWRDINAL